MFKVSPSLNRNTKNGCNSGSKTSKSTQSTPSFYKKLTPTQEKPNDSKTTGTASGAKQEATNITPTGALAQADTE